MRPCQFVLIGGKWYSESVLIDASGKDYATLAAAFARPGAQLRLLLNAPPNDACNGLSNDEVVYQAFWAPMAIAP